MSTLIDAGFIVWGFFVLYALIIVLYVIWMVAANRRADDPEAKG